MGESIAYRNVIVNCLSVMLLSFQPTILEVASPIEDFEAFNSGSEDENLKLDVSMEDTGFNTQGRVLKLSRLHSEFQELEWLGKGGYGDVVKVR